MLYYSLIYPLLLYGIVVWGHNAKALTRKIFILQKGKIHCRAKTSGNMLEYLFERY
jgi:hypothetical protein